MSDYSTDPGLIDIPLQVSEIEELVQNNGKAIGKDQRKLNHLLQRTLSTVRLYKSQVSSLHRDVQEIGMRTERAGAASTLSPADAVQYLTDEQRRELFGQVAQQQLQYMRGIAAEAEAATREARSLTSRVRYEVTGLLEDSTVPLAVRERLEQMLQASPESVPTVPQPGPPPPGFPGAAAASLAPPVEQPRRAESLNSDHNDDGIDVPQAG